MKIFKDADGAEWCVDLTVWDFKRTRDAFGDLLDPGKFWETSSDYVRLVDLLFVLCDKTAQERGLDAKAFAVKFKGDAIERARRALVDEYVDFFPETVRVGLRDSIERVDKANAAVREASRKHGAARYEKAIAEALRADEEGTETAAQAVESPSSRESSESSPTAGNTGN